MGALVDAATMARQLAAEHHTQESVKNQAKELRHRSFVTSWQELGSHGCIDSEAQLLALLDGHAQDTLRQVFTPIYTVNTQVRCVWNESASLNHA